MTNVSEAVLPPNPEPKDAPSPTKEHGNNSVSVLPKNYILKNVVPSATVRILPVTETIARSYVRGVFININVGPIPKNSVSTMARLIGRSDTACVFFPRIISSNLEEVEVWCLVEKGRTHSATLTKKPLAFIIPYLKVRYWKYVMKDFVVDKVGYLRHKSRTDTKAPFLSIDISSTHKLWVEEDIYQYVSEPILDQVAEVSKDGLPQAWQSFAATMEMLISSHSTDEDLPSPPSPPSYLSGQKEEDQNEVSLSSSPQQQQQQQQQSNQGIQDKKSKLETFITPTLQIHDKSVTSEEDGLLYYYYFIDFIPEKK